MPTTNSAESILAGVIAPSRKCVPPALSTSDCEVVNYFVEASQNTFRLLCNLELAHYVVTDGCAVDGFELSGVVRISGAKNITVAVNASEPFCRQVYAAMTADENATTADLHDALGEIANQLVGSAKETLPLEGLQLGLPTIVWGASHHVAFEVDMTRQVIKFPGIDGLQIELGIAPS